MSSPQSGFDWKPMRMPPSIGSLIISYFAGYSASQVDAKRRRKGPLSQLSGYRR